MRVRVAALLVAVLTVLGLGWATAATTETLFGSTVPSVPADSDPASLTVGVTVTAKVAGTVTGVRFYKGTGNTGTHIGAVYSSAGSQLAKSSFTGETQSGWQTVPVNVAVVAGQKFTAAVFMPRGHYAVANPYPWPKSSVSLTGTSGVYRYASTLGRPTSVYGTSNYYVDVRFTPSSSPTPTPTPSPTPSPGFPDASNTGVPAGTVLRTVNVGDSGPCWSAETVGGNPVFYVRCATTIDSLNIPMCVKVLSDDVAFTRSQIGCASYYTINTSDPPRYYSRLSLTDVDVDGLSEGAGIAVMATPGATYTRVNFHGFGSSGPRLASGNVLRDSYIHGFVCTPPDHSAGTSANDGGTNINIVHNRIMIETGQAGCASAAVGIDPDFGQYNGVLIQGNYVAGGAYCMYTDQNQGGQNIRVEGNTFGKDFYPQCGQYGPAAQVQSGNGNTYIGNVYSDGSPATP